VRLPHPQQPKIYSQKVRADRRNIIPSLLRACSACCKQVRLDIHPTIAVLCSTRVKKPNENDWNKLHRLLKYINGTRKHKLILSADDLHVIKWYVDCAFAVHPDFKSHTGGNMTYGQGTPMSMSRKQKLNTRSSTEAELVGPDDLLVDAYSMDSIVHGGPTRL
jgi:hypothetical protein